MEKPAETIIPSHDPDCYLCPGSARANGQVNPLYDGVFAFDNDFAALRLDAARGEIDDGLLVARGEAGLCRVICFSPRHDLTLSRMAIPDIARVVGCWRDEFRTLGALDAVNYVQIFENRGAAMGASNPHPHCQIWASESLPNEAEKEVALPARLYGAARFVPVMRLSRARADSWRTHRLRERRLRRSGSVLGDMAVRNNGARQTPHWRRWTIFVRSDNALLADMLKRLTLRYDNLFETPFPYTMGFHQRPTDGASHPHWHFHGHFYPPLLRSATVRKFMVGFEMLGSPQRDITPESAAERLRELPEVHYLVR